MTATLLIALLLQVYPAPQADAIHHYMWRATGGDRTRAHWRHSPLDPCAKSRLGEGLVDVTGRLRGELHRFARVRGCVAPAVQVRFLLEAFPRHYPNCARRFMAGDLGAFQRCWGEGRGN